MNGANSDKFLNGLEKAQSFLIFFTSIAIVILVSASVLMRYIVKKDFTGGDELITVVSMWLYYIGGAHASMRKKHVEADIIGPLIKTPRGKLIQALAIDAITTLVLGCFTVWGFQYVLWNIGKGTVSIALGIPLGVSQAALAAGLLLMLVHTLYSFAGHIKQFWAGFKGTGPAR